MDLNVSRQKLAKEYIESFKILYMYFKVGGYNRVKIKNGRCKNKSLGDKIYALLPFSIMLISGYHILVNKISQLNALLPTEIFADCTIASFYIIGLINIAFFNKCGKELISMCIEVDCLIGVEKSKFLRDQEVKLVKISTRIAAILTYALLILIIWVYDYPYEIYFSTAVVSFLLSYIYMDVACSLVLYLFMSLRLTYFNMALVNLTSMNPNYLVQHYFSIFWRKQFNRKVDFQERATPKEMLQLLHAIIDLKKLSDNCLSCMLMSGAVSLIVATFTAVQNLVLYVQSKSLENDNNILRLGIMFYWSSTNWILGLLLALAADMVHIQSQQTRLICSYNMLKISTSETHLKLCTAVLSTLEMNDLRTPVYRVFIANTGFILRVAASVSVYTMMQLQLAFRA